MTTRSAGNTVVYALALAIATAVAGDRLYVSKFESRYRALEKQRIYVSNQLATAKIVQENLKHVRELVFENMDLAGHRDTVPPEARFFSFITQCVNDLKLVLISVKPTKPSVEGRITTMGYDLEFEADFFTLGELFAKFENSRRLVSVQNFEIAASSDAGNGDASGKSVRVKMMLNTYRVKKN